MTKRLRSTKNFAALVAGILPDTAKGKLLELWWQDEARVGQQGTLTRVCAAKGQPATQTHDYTRHGTTTLFAALNVLDGTVLGQCAARHRHQEFIRFLNVVEAAVPVGKVVHVILDNYATQKHPKVRAWLEKHPRWVFHFTPTSASRLNAVEGFFAKLTAKRLRRASFRGIVDLQAAIHRFIAEHNKTAKRFVWPADPDRIIASINKAKRASGADH